MKNKEILRKVEANEGLTVEEIILYQKEVKPVKHVYGKYGTLAKKYLEESSSLLAPRGNPRHSGGRSRCSSLHG